MKSVVCPRCKGSGLIQEDHTLIGLAPLLDRPSVVDDDGWLEGDAGEPTVVQPSPMAPTRLARDSEKPTKLLRREDLIATTRPQGASSWTVFFVGLVCGAIGLAAGFLTHLP